MMLVQDVNRRIQGYASALFAGFVKTASDGRKIFYPWGRLGRGYIIACEDDEARLKSTYAAYLLVVAILVTAGSFALGLLGLIGVSVLTLASYAIYAIRLTADMQLSAETLSFTEAFRAQADMHSQTRLLTWLATGVFAICFGIVASAIMPENRMRFAFFLAVGAIIIAISGWMLALRRDDNPADAVQPPKEDSLAAEEAASYITGDVGPFHAWFMTVVGLAFTGIGLFMFVSDPEGRSAAAGIIALFGLLAAFGIVLLTLRLRGKRR